MSHNPRTAPRTMNRLMEGHLSPLRASFRSPFLWNWGIASPPRLGLVGHEPLLSGGCSGPVGCIEVGEVHRVEHGLVTGVVGHRPQHPVINEGDHRIPYLH